MPIDFTCPSCGAHTEVNDSFAGQTGPCGNCGATVTIPLVNTATTRVRKSGSNTLLVVLGMCVLIGVICVGGLAALLLPAIGAAREAARRMSCSNNLKMIAIGMHNYHDSYRTFPPAYIADDNGTPMHSWRMLILNFASDGYIYNQYNFDEPWDSPANSALHSHIPDFYVCPSDPNSRCSYFAISVPSGIFDGPNANRIADIRDGTSNTIMVVEVFGSNAHWMQPTDLGPAALTSPINSTKNGTVISSPHTGGAMVAFADGRVRFLKEETTTKVLQALVSRNGMEEVELPRVP